MIPLPPIFPYASPPCYFPLHSKLSPKLESVQILGRYYIAIGVGTRGTPGACTPPPPMFCSPPPNLNHVHTPMIVYSYYYSPL